MSRDDLPSTLLAAALVACGIGSTFSDPTDYATFRKQTRGPAFLPAPPKPLTKRQKRRLRGKQKEQSV